jgi:hypothetical protein
MNIKNLFYGIFAFMILFLAACTSTDTTAEDNLYEIGLDKTRVRIPAKESLDKTKVRIPEKESLDKTKVRIPAKNE